MGKEQFTFDTYTPIQLEFVKGDGSRLYTADGTEYHDCTSGIAVNSLGHSHPHLVQSLKDAADGIWHLSNVFTIPGQTTLSKRICDHTFADCAFFTNSGAEAMECAIKTARRYHFSKGQPERINILTMEGAFHGRTLATIAAGGQEKYIEGFGPKALGFIKLPFGDMEAMEAAIDDETAAILVEPIQGEGGIREIDAEHLKKMRALCDEHGLLLIFDEIQTGVGRSGALFAHQLHGVEPDIMAVAKGIGGGFPFGACFATTEAASGMVLGTHGSTFGGNPLAMAMGNAVMDVVLEEGFLDSVNDKARSFRQNLSQILDSYPDIIEDIRGVGLLLGLKCKIPNLEVAAKLREHGVLVVPAGDNVIRIIPPLVITDEEINAVSDKMNASMEALQAQL